MGDEGALIEIGDPANPMRVQRIHLPQARQAVPLFISRGHHRYSTFDSQQECLKHNKIFSVLGGDLTPKTACRRGSHAQDQRSQALKATTECLPLTILYSKPGPAAAACAYVQACCFHFSYSSKSAQDMQGKFCFS